MKINCGPTRQEKFDAKKNWHLFFCLWPRRMGSGDCRWLEYVGRKGTLWSTGWDAGWKWEYQAIK